MNIFVLSLDAWLAGQMVCDSHSIKMPVESAQMMAAGLIHHGAQPHEMPLTKKGTPYAGGYAFHPNTVWAYQTRSNFLWLAEHGLSLCDTYTRRYGRTHACEQAIAHMKDMAHMIPDGPLTPFAQSMPDEFRSTNPVEAYRTYYMTEKSRFAKWEKGVPAPVWWNPPKIGGTTA